MLSIQHRHSPRRAPGQRAAHRGPGVAVRALPLCAALIYGLVELAALQRMRWRGGR